MSNTSVGYAILRNTAFITFGTLALKGLNFAFGILVVRQLGDERFGQFNIIVAWVGLFAIFAEWGISQYVMREIARDRTQTPSLFWNLVAIRMILAWLGIIGITLGAFFIGYSREIVIGVLVYTFTFVLAAVQFPLDAVLTAYERLDYSTAMQIIGQLAYIALAGAVLWLDLGLVPFVAVGSIAMFPPIGFAIWAIRRQRCNLGRPHFTPSLWVNMMRAGAPFAIISLTLTIAFSIDTVMLSWTVPEAQVGWYNVAYGLTRSLVGILSGFSVAMVPSLARVYVNNPTVVEQWYFRSIKFICLLSLPAATGCMLLAFPLVKALYLPSTLPAAVALQVLIWDLPLLMFTAFCGNMTTVIGAERDAARIYGFNAIANILLNLYAIPRYGIMGAALVTVLTDLVGTVQFHFLLSRQLRLPNIRWMLTRISVATALMGIVVAWVASILHFTLVIILGGMVYIILVIGMGLIEQPEWDFIGRFLGRFGFRFTQGRD